jgi:hypothetical protein
MGAVVVAAFPTFFGVAADKKVCDEKENCAPFFQIACDFHLGSIRELVYCLRARLM